MDSMKFKSALDPDRMAFNNLIKDLSSSLKNAVNESTTKLSKINASYTKDLQLTEAIEDIFGKVNFKNTSEILAISKKLETLFSQKGLSPQYIHDFLKRIGISSSEFRASEAVRQIMTKATGANTKGLNLGEILQQITSAIITPNAVKNVAILTGLSEKIVGPLLQKTAPSARGALIKSLMGNPQE